MMLSNLRVGSWMKTKKTRPKTTRHRQLLAFERCWRLLFDPEYMFREFKKAFLVPGEHSYHELQEMVFGARLGQLEKTWQPRQRRFGEESTSREGPLSPRRLLQGELRTLLWEEIGRKNIQWGVGYSLTPQGRKNYQ